MERNLIPRRFAAAVPLLVCLAVAGCADEGVSYEVEVVRTANGVPHIIADDFGSMGYGYGYAYAQDNFCVLMREIIRARGESALWLDDEPNLTRDFLWRFYNSDAETRRGFVRPLPAYARDAIEGFAAGMNRHLREVGVEGLPDGEGGCRGESWVREIDLFDLAKVYRKLVLRAGVDALGDYVLAAEAPMMMTTALDPARLGPLLQSPAEGLQIDHHDLGVPEPSEIGSNAYGFGGDVTDNGRGLLLGNPHFPWAGHERFYMAHLTVRGQYDAAGASLHGVPIINIGFNGDVAWSHTVSTARRFVLYELELDPEDPLRYIVDGESRPIRFHEVTAEERMPDGSVETRSETIYMTDWGPVVDLGAVNGLVGGWPNISRSLLVMRDVNLGNTNLVQSWMQMGQARNMDEFEEAMSLLGNPWANTVAVDRDGEAYYADVGAVPGVTQELFDACTGPGLTSLLSELGIPALDGSRSECALRTGEGAPDGLLGYDQLPHLRTRDYVANANDSFWLPNPSSPLEGYPFVLGQERYEQSIRTRQTFAQAEARLAGTDGRGPGGISVDQLQDMMFASDSYAEELVRDDFVTACSAVVDWAPYGTNGAAYVEGCGVLLAWDGRFRGASVGAHVFREAWERFEVPADGWLIPFDADDPVNTPRDLDLANSEVVEALRTAFAAGVDRLVAAGISLTAPFTAVQFRTVGSERIPVHGMPSGMGFSVITSRLVDGVGYTNIRHGNSYMQTVTWDDTECPVAHALLSYSQSTDPASPHYADQTRLYSDATWPEFPFCEAEVAAAAVSRELLVGP